ncbi:MAG: histidine--tRNA ligase [Deltaproteobacteria bacterium]|nr:histidine--tRNA ligase [Deltaproteobacteria bacterium]
MKIQSIRGFNDILPEKIKRWHRIEERARTIFELYGFSEIRIPVIEFTDIFARSLGTTTDIVEKEMYTFTDRDGSSITLRPEGTAGVVRAFIEHSMYAQSPITKLYYSGMMFRHERPQKGRYRGFYQIGAELFGSKEPLADAEVIIMLWRFFEAIGIAPYLKLEISSLGDENCRPAYKQKLVEFFMPSRNQLCEDCRRRLEVNPLRILDCKKESCKQIAQDAPSMLDNLCSECREHFESVKNTLTSLGALFVSNPRIVRGLDYYTRTVFEVTTEELGAQNTVGAGGRYDHLVEELEGPPTPAVGFAVGMERIILLHEKKFPEGFQKEVDTFIAHLGSEAKKTAFLLAYELRKNGVFTEMDYENKSLKSQLKRADKLGVKYTIIIGEEELSRGKVKVRDMRKSTEDEMNLEDVKKLAIKFRI